jgi:CHASE2 domain-containing sensor protein
VADQSRDAALALRADIEPSRHLHAPLIFVTIDEGTYASLGRKEVVPALAIERMLRPIADAGPRFIVLDIDVSTRREPKDVRVLSRTLAYVQDKKIPLLLVRGTPPHASPDAPVYLPRTPYDALIDGTSASWTSGEAIVSQGVTRGVSSWVLTCVEGQPRFLIGVAPLASELYYAQGKLALDVSLKPDWTCSGASATPPNAHHIAQVPSFDGAITRLTNVPDRLVHYSLRWNGPDWTSSQVVVRDDARKRPLLSVLPAQRILSGAANAFEDTGDLFKGAIVVVGASNIAAGDLQNTPVGDMPGAMVLLNHIRGFLDFGPEGPEQFLPGLWIMLGMSAVTGLFVAVFSRWTSSWGGLALPVLFTVLWWGASALLLGGTGSFALSLVQFLVGFAVIIPNLRKKSLSHGGS